MTNNFSHRTIFFKFFCLSMMALFLLSCRSVKDAERYTDITNQNLLPSLSPYVDIESFHRAYTSFQFMRQPDRYEFSKAIDMDSAIFTSSMMFRQRIVDDLLTFEHEVYNNITDTTTQKKGYIVCRITNGFVDPGNYALAVISGLTLFIPNLLGMPISKVDTFLELEVNIYNLNEERVASYVAEGKGRAWVALYYGYSDWNMGSARGESNVYRKSSILAFNNAMRNIKEQINKDAQNIAWGLR